MTYNELYLHINKNLSPRLAQSPKSLEEYWRSLYPLFLPYKDQQPTADLFYDLLVKGLDASILPLDPTWLDLVIAPDPDDYFDEFEELPPTELHQKEFDFFLYCLSFQIAELHKMKGKQLENEYKYFGIDSETGNRWYNFDAIGILECGLHGFMNNGGKDGILEDWVELGMLLEMGRIYE